jgi:hypothetical protein
MSARLLLDALAKDDRAVMALALRMAGINGLERDPLALSIRSRTPTASHRTTSRPSSTPRHAGRAAGRLDTEPRHPALRMLRGIGLLAAGLVVLVEPDAVLQLVLTVLGV